MKTLFTLPTLFILAFSLQAQAADTSSCVGCHGANFETPALGVSKIVSEMTSEEIKDALVGYKNGTYGGSMASLMQAQIAHLSAAEIQELAEFITK